MVEYVCLDFDHDCSCHCDCHCPGTVYHSRFINWRGQRLIFHMAIDVMPPIIQSALERKLPPKIDYGIAFIGCGGIVNYGHIPAYKASGFHMIGGYDINPEAAEKTVREHGLGKVYRSLDEVLLDPIIEIVDIAVVAWEQKKIVAKAVA